MQLEKLIVPMIVDKQGFSASLASVSKLAAVGFGAIAAGAGLVATGIAKAFDMTKKWAGELDALQDVTDLTNEQAAGLNVLLRKHQVSADDAAKAFTFLNKNLVDYKGELGSTGKTLAEWGINVKDANGQLRSNADLTEEIARKYRDLAPGAERTNFLTKTFGKSSLELNDALLELADKGLSSFEEKAKKLGLAIDPERYERFKQSLEELKLVGLGLAVSVTEKLMPVLEGLLDWFSEKAPEGLKAFQDGGISGLFDWVAGEFKLLDEKVSEEIDNLPWGEWGKEFGDFVGKMLTSGFEAGKADFLPKFVVSLTDGIDEAIRAAGQSSSTPVAWGEYWRLFFDNVKRANDPPMRTFFINWETSWTNGIRNAIPAYQKVTTEFFVTWEKTWTAAIRTWGINTYNAVIEQVNKIISAFNKLPGISSIGYQNTIPYASNAPVAKGAHKKRATGGPVVAGNSYDVAEFNKAEVYTPNQSGRVDAAKSTTVVFPIDELIEGLSRRLVQDLVKVRA